MMVAQVWTFDDFEPGQSLGAYEVPIDATRLALWQRIHGPFDSDGPLPSGMLISAMMEAYTEVVQPRPPGNIHVGQRLTFSGAALQPGALLRTAFICLGKQVRKERRWLTFGVSMHARQAWIMDGEISVIWAA